VRADLIAFKDGASFQGGVSKLEAHSLTCEFAGQVLGEGASSQPHGYGRLQTTDMFVMTGYFYNGKARGAFKGFCCSSMTTPAGPGVFRAPNGDEFWGTWNAEHKRHGRGLSIRAQDKRQAVEL